MSITIHVGLSGSGKSHALFKICEAHVRTGWIVVVVDTNDEAGRFVKHGVRVSGARGAQEAIRRGHKLLIWTVGDEIGDEGVPDAEAAASFALKTRKVLFAITEAHLHLPNGQKPTAALLTMISRFRHFGCAVILDTQRLVQLSTIPRGNCAVMRVFGVVSKRDLDELSESGGRQLADAAIECARRCEEPPGPNQPGWHVEANGRRMCPPYHLRRFPA